MTRQMSLLRFLYIIKDLPISKKNFEYIETVRILISKKFISVSTECKVVLYHKTAKIVVLYPLYKTIKVP